ncbi:zinc finger protein 839 [Lingula anatina]|uniref:Zinc finger protein 839 n=1 Tax=Lingula anatina TaxID=7574 RepID=A0A1S3J2U6_LINAN|nr:zinc finger protein 839 [Lingula anatina]|eukprot:XP_013404601.1 zinc finger protein 839 [Lingula anatina]
MADEADDAVHMIPGQGIVNQPDMITEGVVNENDGEEVNEDILQQALEEAQEEYDHATVVYSDGSMIANSNDVIVNSHVDGVGEVYEQDNVVYHVVDNTMEAQDPSTGLSTTQISPTSEPVVVSDGNSDISRQVVNVVQTTPSNIDPAAPLGTSDNPIRIVQQGNQYTSLQQLSAEQVAQIMQVLQNQHVAKKTQESSSGSSVLFNPQTNTRIVYRVIQPSELHKNGSGLISTPSQLTRTISQQTPGSVTGTKRQYRKRHKGEDDDKTDGPELSKEEKEERKKHRPRTRSGRVSKPPKHMVQDYKHIHPVDWDEDMDDSDGGYSDFKYSEEEDGEGRQKDHKDSNYIHPGVGTSRRKTNKCETCDKTYIGRGGLARHYRLYPSHGRLEDDPTHSNSEKTNGLLSVSEDSNTQDSFSKNTTGTSSAVTKPTSNVSRAMNRARNSLLQENNPHKRKAKLRDIVRQCENEELMEVVLPKLAKVITTWEFLFMKAESSKSGKPVFQEMFKEFESLFKQMQKSCEEYLRPLPDGETITAASKQLEITDTKLAESLGLNDRVYLIRDVIPANSDDSNTFHYKLLTADARNLTSTATNKRTLELVSADQLVTQPSKKMKVKVDAPAVTVLPSMHPEILENQQPEEAVTTHVEKVQPTNNEAIEQQQVVTHDPQSATIEVNSEEQQVVDENGELNHILEGQEITGENVETHVIDPGASIIQTEDGTILIQNPDGTTVQLHADQGIPLETVQALLAMENDGQIQIDHTSQEECVDQQ